jgi:hypothetical protein
VEALLANAAMPGLVSPVTPDDPNRGPVLLLMSACIGERSQACAGRVMLLSQKGAKVVKVG